MLQISTYWRPGDSISIDLCPGRSVAEDLKTQRKTRPQSSVAHYLNEWTPKRFAEAFSGLQEWHGPLQSYSNADISSIAETLSQWTLKPAGTEGYRTAEVTLGGVNTRQLSSKTMAVNERPNLFFIGEVVDVTGHLGGHNFQWAWASGVAAGEVA
jgi:hypothetical protein